MPNTKVKLSFLPIVNIENFDFCLMKVLIERWCDTTNTFLFPCGKITLTPIDFTINTGL